MARVGAWIIDKAPDEAFTAMDIHSETGISYPLVSPVLRRLIRVELVSRYHRTERNGSSVVPYSRNEHDLWGPFGSLCILIVDSEVGQND